ncbi:hypothetical protein C8Q78DRAFT_977745, partial [Trametes maxima]
GTTLAYQDCDVPAAPSLSFLRGICDMDRMWDDSGASQEPISPPLEILGVPIPIVDWPHQKWLDWKHLIIEYRQLGLEGFWFKYSRQGKRLSLTVIVGELRAERKAENERLAAEARDEFADRFNHVFAYRKGKEQMVCQNAASIARSFRRMQDGHE